MCVRVGFCAWLRVFVRVVVVVVACCLRMVVSGCVVREGLKKWIIHKHTCEARNWEGITVAACEAE